MDWSTSRIFRVFVCMEMICLHHHTHVLVWCKYIDSIVVPSSPAIVPPGSPFRKGGGRCLSEGWGGRGGRPQERLAAVSPQLNMSDGCWTTTEFHNVKWQNLRIWANKARVVRYLCVTIHLHHYHHHFYYQPKLPLWRCPCSCLEWKGKVLGANVKSDAVTVGIVVLMKFVK